MKTIKRLKLNELQEKKLKKNELKKVTGGACGCGGICFGSISTGSGESISHGYSYVG